MKNQATIWSGLLLLTATMLTLAGCLANPSTAKAAVKSNAGAPPVVAFLAASRPKGVDTTVTFAQPFVAGDVPSGDTLTAVTRDGDALPTQIDWKATNNDGSRRHGVITVSLPMSERGKNVPVGLYRVRDSQSQGNASSAAPPKDIDAHIVLDIDGTSYSASFQKLLASGLDRTWLSGPLVTEWHVSGPVTTTTGEPHDRIWVQFYVRHYWGSGKTRVVAVVENTWAFKNDPRNISYDAKITVNGSEVYSRQRLKHSDHARWRKSFWIGGEPVTYVRHDLNYLKATGAIPNYDPSLRVPRSTVAKLYKQYLASDRDPMDISIVTRGMANTGGRPDIGPLPAWAVLRLLTMDPRLIEVDRGIDALAGSWPIHLRDEKTRLPVSLERHPRLTTHPNLLKRDRNPLPVAAYGETPSDLHEDLSHHPSFGFVPYLLSGDYYYLEELQFWAASNPLRTSPSYRGYDKGLFKWTQVRGQAWALRTLGRVAYITPDDHPMKKYWLRQLQNNLDWYNAHYTAPGANPNKLGFLEGQIIYKDKKGLRRGASPWQDDFFTWTMGSLVDLGFESARPMLDYKARFSVGRMTAPGYCWLYASIYKLFVRDGPGKPFYTNFANAYDETVNPKMVGVECNSAKMAKLRGKGKKVGEMVGYASSPQGFPANMQPALAAAVDAGVPNSREAWRIFINRPVKPNYNSYPNWDIVPRER